LSAAWPTFALVIAVAALLVSVSWLLWGLGLISSDTHAFVLGLGAGTAVGGVAWSAGAVAGGLVRDAVDRRRR
uniref:hypothetical protein n=1 Tax=Nocardia otitidiscaviarum TaxID=1823 RepID=UPI0005B77297